MPLRFLLTCLACLLFAPFGAFALELEDFHLPMTRNDADALLSKDYQFRVLQDVTIRRSWNDGNRKVSIDFTPTNDKAVLITVEYKKPVTATVANRDAEAMAGGKLGKWRKGKARKMAEIGLGKAQYVRTADGGFIFRERAKKGKYTRLAYFASTPKDNRMELNDFNDSRSVTALGSVAGADGVKYLRQDEERRRKQPARPKPAKRPDAIATVIPKPESAAPAADDFEDTNITPDDDETEDEALATEEGDWKAKLGLDKLTPMHYGIIGGVLLLLIIIRVIVKKRAAARRAALAASIINKGRSAAKKQEEQPEGEK